MAEDHMTFGGVARRKLHERLICLRLGLDPAQVTHIQVDVEPGGPARVTWDGIKKVPLSELQELIAPPPPDNEQCPTCTFPSRSTVGLVCMTCGWDYANGEKPGT